MIDICEAIARCINHHRVEKLLKEVNRYHHIAKCLSICGMIPFCIIFRLVMTTIGYYTGICVNIFLGMFIFQIICLIVSIYYIIMAHKTDAKRHQLWIKI